MTDVVVGVYNQIAHRPEAYQKRIQSITEYGFDLLTSVPDTTKIVKIVQGNSVDDILHQAADLGQARWLYLTAYGHRVMSDDLVERMISLAQQHQAALVGHILDDDPQQSNQKFFSLHHQCLLLDLEQWQHIGRPSWGTPQEVEDQVLPCVTRSSENAHDDYTPLWIKSAQRTRNYTGSLREGWNLLASFVTNGHTVWNFDHEIRRRKGHIYPEAGEIERYFQDPTVVVTQPSQRQYLDIMNSIRQQTFVFNNEPANRNLVGSKLVNSIYCVAAGFKPLEFLAQRRFNSNTKVFYFDYSLPALKFRQWLVENWDGQDYITAINQYTRLNPDFHTNWRGLVDYTPQWQVIQDRFGGRDCWLDLWQRYRQLPHHYIEIDLFNQENRQQLIQHMQSSSAHDHGVLWYSNAFYSDYSRFCFDVDTLSQWHESFHNQLKQLPSSIEVFGMSPRGQWEEILYDEPRNS